MRRYSVVDVESTGLCARDRVIEVAVLTVGERGEVLSAFESVVNPERDPGPTQLHGITAEECRAAPSFRELAREVHRRLVGTILVAHNLRFDWSFLREELRRCGVSFLHEPVGLCTREGSRRLALPAELEAACEALGLEARPSHRARADAEATNALWVALTAKGAFRTRGQPLKEGLGWHRLPASAPACSRLSLSKTEVALPTRDTA